MKKANLFCIIALALFSIGCSQKSENLCTFNGVLNDPNLEGKNVYLYDYADRTLLDSAIIENGHFTFADTVSNAKIGFVQTERTETARYYLYYIMEQGTVYGDLVTDSLSGTPLNDTYYKYQMEKSAIKAAVIEAYQVANLAEPEEMAAATALFDSTYNEYKQCTHKFYEDNKDNVLGVLALETLCEAEEYNVEQFSAILADAAPVVRNYPSILKKVEKLQQMENTSVGKHYIDVDVLDSETGKMQKLSDYVEGKVALIDFWASWCGPCRRAIPHVAEMHSKYAGKGLTVIGLNVWDSPEKQAEIIKAMNMNWIQIADTTSENIVSTTYSVEGIPHIMLIDANGTIVARNLNENNMENAIKEALGIK